MRGRKVGCSGKESRQCLEILKSVGTFFGELPVPPVLFLPHICMGSTSYETNRSCGCEEEKVNLKGRPTVANSPFFLQ